MRYTSQNRGAVPEDTARVAIASFPKGNVYLTVRDKLGPLYDDSRFAPLFSHRGQAALSPAMLALVCVAQYAEGLSDVQAAEAVRSRIDWKYLLGLPLEDAGFDPSVLTEFRKRLVDGALESQLLDALVERFLEAGWIQPKDRQRTDSTSIVAAVRRLNRLELVGETLRQALEVLTLVAPGWLSETLSPDWFDRYSHRFEQYRLPTSKAEREALASAIGADGFALYAATQRADAPLAVRGVEALETLRHVWLQQFWREDDRVGWRKAEDQPPATQRISSPYDVQARYAKKRETSWHGYAVHVTETCEPERPLLITQIHTTPAGEQDHHHLAQIQDELLEQGLQPSHHLVDAGYVTAPLLVSSQAKAIDLVGPVVPDVSWQARAQTGYALADFRIDWAAQQASCPAGQPSSRWEPGHDQHRNPIIEIRFAPRSCAGCAARQRCTTARGGRKIRLRPQAEHEARQAALERQVQPEFQDAYAPRAGIEGTLSLAVRSFELRRTRYIGLAKTHLGHLLTAAALNLTRIAYWLQGRTRAPTRLSHFARLGQSLSLT